MWEGQEQADIGTCVGEVFYKNITEPTFKNFQPDYLLEKL